MHGVQCEFSPLRLNREQSGQTRQGFRRIHDQSTATLLSDRKEQGLVMAKESDVITSIHQQQLIERTADTFFHALFNSPPEGTRRRHLTMATAKATLRLGVGEHLQLTSAHHLAMTAHQER